MQQPTADTPKYIQQWQQCLQLIKDNLDPVQFKAWFSDVAPASYVDGNITLAVPSAFFVEQFDERYLNLLRAVLNRVYGPGTQLFYQYQQVANDPNSSVRMRSDNRSGYVKPLNIDSANPFVRLTNRDIDSQLNPHYTFENYCAGEANKIGRSIGEAIANNPKCKTFNPLFVFGPTGVGKTHLIQAIGIRTKETTPSARVLYITARLFESQYTAAANAKPSRINEFFALYQSIDTLIIDDVQDLGGPNKTKTQNTLFHIFNHLHQNGRQIIMSSDTAPAMMQGFEERMQSRFKWGMSVELSKPDMALRRQVLVQKAETDGIEMPDEVIDYIAASVTESIRDLEGVMVSLVAHAAILNMPVSIELARSVVANAVKINRRALNFEMIAREVCEYYSLDPDVIFSKGRKREISDARQVVMYLAKKLTGMSYKAIGARLQRTHATVLYACEAVENRVAQDKQLRLDLERIEASMR